LGTTTDGFLDITEQDRESHLHILGSTGEGKSKFLELLLRQDIDNGYAACLLDPSDNGETAMKVLKYACKQGYEKIIYINPADFLRTARIPPLNPLHYKAPAPAVIGSLMDAIRVLWGQANFSDTPRIQKYLPALLTVLHASSNTLTELKYFMDRRTSVRRKEMLSKLDEYNISRMVLESALHNVHEWEGFLPTVNRLMPFLDPTMELIFGSHDGINFQKLVADKWIVLVNLDPEPIWGTEQSHQRLLGTIVINEIVYAISRLRNRGWQGRYYLYIDECGDYATDKIATILYKKRKSGLSLSLAHQAFDQFTDKSLAAAVNGLTKIKVLFNTPGRDDRDKMLRMMYSGDLTEKETTYAASQLKRGQAIVKNNKQPPRTLDVSHIEDTKVDKKVFDSYLKKIYASDFYRSIADVRAEIKNRFVQPATTFQTASGADKKAKSADTGTLKQQDDKRNVRQDSASSKGSTVFDHLADSADVLLKKKGRKRTKDNLPPSKEG